MKIGFVGLGIMGEPMCENIISKHDDEVFIFNPTASKMDRLKSLGAIACTSNLQVAENVDIFISMVPKSEDSKSVYTEILPALKEGKICVDMSTISPSVSVEISEKVRATGAAFVDAPVVKSRPAAVAGKLGIYVGGDEKVFEIIKPILSYMGENIIRMGENGKGLVMKICHNALVAQIQNGVNETATIAVNNGIDILTFAKAISYGGGQNFYLDSKKEVIYNEDYTTAFSVENEHKDLGICLELAEESNVKVPGVANAKLVYDEALLKGYGKEDFSATIKIVRDR